MAAGEDRASSAKAPLVCQGDDGNPTKGRCITTESDWIAVLWLFGIC